MKKLVLSTALTLALACAAAANPVTFEFEGRTWTITNSANGAPVSRINMTSGFHQACPHLRIKLEATRRGPKLSPEEKFRGDTTWHVVCDWAPPAIVVNVAPPSVAVHVPPPARPAQP